ncbi:hypothetical protein [Litorimonas sp. WD9-15]|uniref:hypothetical protein n=1 Tax=Litorimonas sp. WD9-15 TaxID=3418716 RepID=UPI003D08D076
MMTLFKSTIVILGLLALPTGAVAANVAEVRRAMAAGDYDAAFTVAETIETAESLALAAESLLSDIMLGTAHKNKKQAKQARELADKALELDAAHQNARLQFTIADGFVTRETGDVSAWMKKLPQKTQAVVQAYRLDYPDDVRGDALMGAWHLAIVRKAGDGNARKWFGANVADGQAFYDKAIAFEPDNAVIGVNYAFAMIALEDEDMPNVSAAWAILEHLSALDQPDHLNRTVMDYGREALTVKADRDAARDYAGMFLDGEKPELN